MSINYPEWAGRLSFHVEALLDDTGPEWLQEQRRENAARCLVQYGNVIEPAHDEVGFVDLCGLAEL